MSETMGAALRRIAKIKGELSELDEQLKASACWVEGKEVPYLFEPVWAARQERAKELVHLQSKLALANAMTTFQHSDDVFTPAEAIRTLDELKAQIKLLTDLPIRDRKVDSEKVRESDWDDNAEKSVTRTTVVVHYSAISKLEQKQRIQNLKEVFASLNDALEAHNHRTMV